MARLIWTPRALSEVERLYDFLAPKNPDAAKRAAQAILDAVEVLRTHPEIGPLYEDTELRQWFIPFANSGYLVLYRYDQDAVTLLAMRHGKEVGFGS